MCHVDSPTDMQEKPLSVNKHNKQIWTLFAKLLLYSRKQLIDYLFHHSICHYWLIKYDLLNLL